LHLAPLDSVPIARWLAILNDPRVRAHLIPHRLFDESTARAWLAGKQAIDDSPGGFVRAVIVDGEAAGYAGLQPDDADSAGRYEIAIVLYPGAWGAGAAVYRALLREAARLGHRELTIALLETRRAMRALPRLGWRAAGEGTWAGQRFRRYVIGL
jgi:RimJ/RimL family protein N-acetyltransferase